MKRIKLWDLPTRVFHWLLAFSIVGAFVSQKIGGNAMVWHGRFGLAILGLLVFRIVWGFAGSTYVCFVNFVRGPSAIAAYLRGQWQGIGHNPLGALSVLALLCVPAAFVATGLFANDDIAFQGPLYALVGAELSGRLTGIHKLMEPLLILLVLLHVGAIVFYARVKKENLVRPMITGWTESADAAPASGGGLVPFVIAVLLALGAVWAASGALLPPPAPVAPQATPSW